MHLSIAVPSPCGNRCKFCIANMQKDVLDRTHPCGLGEVLKSVYMKRMAYAKEAGCSSLTLTGEGEPLLNRQFLRTIGELNAALPSPFHHIQIQTSGMTLSSTCVWFLTHDVGVSVVGLSLCHFNSGLNADYMRPRSPEYHVVVDRVCRNILSADLSLRICLNLTDLLIPHSPQQLLREAEVRGASQVTFRELYAADVDCPESRWIAEHRAPAEWVNELRDYIKTNGRPLPRLGTGLEHYSLMGMSVVIDGDCMATSNPEEPRSLILREDGKLYSRWDDKGSLIF